MGRPPLPAEVVTRAKILTARGESQREVARLLGISRGSVQKILGKGPPATERSVDVATSENTIRCAGCGGLVIPPCMACEAIAADARSKRILKAADAQAKGTGKPGITRVRIKNAELRTNLSGFDRVRYRRIHARKEATAAERGEKPLTQEELRAKYEGQLSEEAISEKPKSANHPDFNDYQE